MLGDYNENVKNVEVAKMLARRKQVAQESANNDKCSHALSSSLICLFDLPSLNLEANAYYELANFDFCQQKPPAISKPYRYRNRRICGETSGIALPIRVE